MPSRAHLYKKLRAAARRNSAIFAKMWREGVDPGAHQYEMARRADDEAIQFQADFWPRDHGKSEIFCIAYPLRRVCEDPDVRILIVQKTATEAEKTLQVIKTELERNRELKSYYAPHWQEQVGQADISNATGVVEREGRREGAWQQRRIYVKRNRRGKDPTIEVVGVGGAITGGHFDIIILDDVEDDENTKTADRLRSMVQWFNGTIMQLREPHTKMMVVGTLKTNAQDIYKTIKDNPVWNCRTVSAVLEPAFDEIEYEPVYDGHDLVGVKVKTQGVKVLWPQRWPIEALLFEMLASVRSIWIREKLNDLRALAGQVFKKDWFRYYEDVPADFEAVIQIWDTAWEEKQTADWSVCITLGLRAGMVYVLDVFREKLETPGLLRAMQEQYNRWKPREVMIEDRASGKSAIQVLKVESKLPVVAISPGGRDKVARTRAVTPYYESGRVLHRAGALWLDVFEDELLMFPEGENDDQVDGITYGLLRLFLGEGVNGWEKSQSAPAQVVRREGLFG